MKKYFILVIALIIVAFFVFENNKKEKGLNKLAQKMEPSDFLQFAKNYPDYKPDLIAYKKAINIVTEKMTSRSVSSVDWLLEGPTNIGGRFNKVLVHPINANIIYAGAAKGGVFKTIDGGVNWLPIFDESAYLSIGDIVFDPNNSDIVYIGTGDPNISGYPTIGNGVYKSIDAGNSWVNIGLTDNGIVSKIRIDPNDPNIIYVATMGVPFERDTNRGLYKTIDGGVTWSNVLYLSDQAGVIDLIMDKDNSQILYAAGWDRIRNNQESIIAGPSSKIYKSIDGGSNWETLISDLPTIEATRIGLCQSGVNSDTLFAIYINPTDFEVYGIYKTINGGLNWTALSTSGIESALGGFGWYFGQIRVNPQNDDELFVLGVDLYKSTNGGANWSIAGPPWYTYEFHADKHDLTFAGSDLICATDGGLYKSTDGGDNWDDIDDIPNNQFYRVTVDPHNPGYYCGGVQDNGTTWGNSTTLNSWSRLFGGDGFQPLYNPDNSNLVYVETQRGNLRFSNGSGWQSFNNGINSSDRRSWDMPIIMSDLNYDVLFTGTYKVYKNSSAPYGSWSAISPDLTNGTDDRYHVITTVAQSPIDEDVLYAGTSDGIVQHSIDGGTNWVNVSAGLPNRYITMVKPSPTEPNSVYVSCSGYKDNDNIPHIHKSIDNGLTWIDISSNLPQLAINDIYIFEETNDDQIFVGTDGGVYYTLDGGLNWSRAGNGMPIVPVNDIDYDAINHKLIAGTFARSMMSIDVDLLISTANVESNEISESMLTVFPNPANDYISFSKVNSKVYKIIDATGKLIKQGVFNKSTVNVSDLNAGVYYSIIGNQKAKFIKN